MAAARTRLRSRNRVDRHGKIGAAFAPSRDRLTESEAGFQAAGAIQDRAVHRRRKELGGDEASFPELQSEIAVGRKSFACLYRRQAPTSRAPGPRGIRCAGPGGA